MKSTCIAAGLLASVSMIYAGESGPEEPGSPSASAVRSGPAAGSLRWSNYARDSFYSPGAFFASVIPAVGDQQRDRPTEYGQGWDAFGDRLVRRAAQYQLQNAMYHASAAVLKTQTGYSRCACEGGFRRLGYALSRTLVTRTENGRMAPNAPLLGGFIGGGMIATAWYPDRYRATGEGSRTAAFQIGGRTMFNVLREFQPEVKRLFLRR